MSLKNMSLEQLTQLLNFTNAYADHVTGNVTTFSNDNNVINFADMKITDSNRAQILSEAKKQAETFAINRNNNRRRSMNFSNASPDESKLIESVKAWAADKKNHLRGSKKI